MNTNRLKINNNLKVFIFLILIKFFISKNYFIKQMNKILISFMIMYYYGAM